MSLFRRLFPNPNGKVPCSDCGAMILRRTAAETGGFCAPCHRLGPDLRRERAALTRSINDGSAFRLSPAERASAAPLTDGMPDPALWQPHPDDTHLTDAKTRDEIIALVANGTKPALYLAAEGQRTLTLETRGPYAALIYADNRTGVMRSAHGPTAPTAQVPAEFHVFMTCPCCGDAMTPVPSKFHLPRKAALSGLDHILSGTASAHLQWISGDYPAFLAAGRG